jgi:hypothetical protein
MASSCEHGNEQSGCVKSGEFFVQLSNDQLLKILCCTELLVGRWWGHDISRIYLMLCDSL